MESYLLVAQTIQSDCANEPDLEQRCRKAMKAAANHWMVTEDQQQFKGAIGAVLLAKETTEEEKARINATVRSLAAFNAMVSGVPVDLDAMIKNADEGPAPIPLVKWWHEVKDAA
jgi:hypothetical protein